MKKLILLSAITLLFACSKKPVPAPQMKAMETPQSSNLSNALRKWKEVDVSSAKISELKSNDSLYYSMPIGDTTVTLALKRVDFNPTVIMSDGSKYVSDDNVIYYQGVIIGRDSSKAAITLDNGEISGIVLDKVWKNTIIGKIENKNVASQTIIYNDTDLLSKPNIPLDEDQLEIPDAEKIKRDLQEQISTSAAVEKCVKLYWNIDYDIYVAKGAQTVSFIQGLFNQVQIYNAITNIKIELHVLKINTTADPFTGASTMDYLNQFQAYLGTTTEDVGDVKMLLGTGGGGGVAYVNALGTNYNIGYAGISLSYNTVPTYSWGVMVTAHEQGHVMGSYHSHDCVWLINGISNQRIDNCGGHAGYGSGSCADVADPPGGGCGMSYCHLRSVGINMSLGLGELPSAFILSRIAAVSSITSCDPDPADSCAGIKVTPSIPITTPQTNIPPNTTVTVTANPVNGGTKKRIDWYKNNVLDTAHSLTYSFVPVNGNQVKAILNNPDSCTTSHTATSNTLTFTVAPPPSGCAIPGGLATTNITSTSARPTWGSVSGYTAFQLQYRLKSTGSWTGKVTSNLYYTITGLTSNTDYEWQVKAVCGSSSSGFSAPQYFKTTGSGGTTPTISITKSPAGTSCANTSLTFTATTNASTGTNSWTIGGMTVGGNLTSITTDTMSRDNTVVVTRIGITGMNGTSCTGSLSVSVTPENTFTAAADICTQTTSTGKTWTFTARFFPTATNVTYEWFKNNVPVSTSQVYYTSNLSFIGQEVYCKVKNGRACSVPQIITTPPIKIQ